MYMSTEAESRMDTDIDTSITLKYPHTEATYTSSDLVRSTTDSIVLEVTQ